MADNIVLSTTVTMDIHPMIRDSKVAKGELKSLNKSLKAQSKAFKETGYDAEALAERQRLLGHAYKAQNKIVEDTTNAYKEVVKNIKDKNNMTADEANAISITRGQMEKARYELRKYSADMEKTKDQHLQLSKSSAELTKRHKEIGEVTKRTVEQYKKMGSQMGVLKTKYDGLGRQIRNNNVIMNKEKEVLTSLKDKVSQNSSVYQHHAAVIEDLQKKHETLISRQQKVSISMDKMSGSTNRVTSGISVMGLGIAKTRKGFRTMSAATHKASATINRLGSSFRNIGLVIGGMALGGLIQNISTLVPLAGSLISVLAGLGGMATSLAGAGIGIGGAFGIATIAVKAFAGQAQTALQMVEDGEMGASSALTHYKSSLSGLQSQWKALVQANSGAIFNTMANGINIARYALTTLNPFLTKTANQISAFSSRMKDWVTNSKNMQAVFGVLNDIGPRVFQNILNAIFKVTDGVAHLATQFAPLVTYMSGMLEGMANKFNKWANSADTDSGVARFIEYTKRNLPITLDIFFNVFSGIADLFVAFSGHSENVMKGMQGVTQSFKDWAANLSSTEGFKQFIAYLEANGPKVWELLKNLGSIFANLIVGLAPIGSLMLDMAVSMSGFFKALTKYHVVGMFVGVLAALVGIIWQLAPIVILIGQLISTLGGLAAIIGVLTNPITWIIAGIVGLGAAFVIAYKQSETFRNIINGALRGVVVAFQWLWSGIKTVGGAIGSFIMNNIIGPIAAFGAKIGGQLSAFWAQNGPMIIQAVQNIWAVVGPILNTMFNFFKTVFMGIVGVVGAQLRMIWLIASPILTAFSQSFMAVWNFIKLQFQNVWNMIKGIVQGGLNVILGLVKIFGGVFTGNWSAVWSGLGQVVRGLLGVILAPIKFLFNTIKNTLGLFGTVIKSVWFGIWGSLKGVVVGTLGVISSVVRLVLGGIKTFFIWIWTSIKGIVLPIIRSIGTGIRAVFGAIGKFIRLIFNGIASFIKWVWNGIKNSIMFYVNLIKRLVTAAWNILSRVTRAIFNGVKNFLISVWTVIKNRVVGQARLLWSIMRGVWNTLSKVSRAIFSSVRNFLVSIWTNLKNRVVAVSRALWNVVRSVWNTLSKVSRSIFSNVRNFIVSVWNNLRNRVVSVSRALWNVVRGIWNTLSKVSRSIFSNVRNYLISVWNNLRNRVVSITRTLWNTVRGIWNALSSGTRKVFNSIRSFLTSLWNNIRNKVTSIVRSLWNGVRGTWNNLSNGTKRIFNGVRNYLVDKWNGIKNSVTGIASDLWASVKQTFTNMKNGLSGLADKIGGVINGMVKGIKKGLNSLIKGVNWVAKKLGVDQKIPELSTGTGSASYAGSGVGAGVSNGVVSSGGFATVNDRGPGNGTGPSGHQEVIQRANGTMVAPKGRDVTVPLGKGDIVHSGKAVQKAQKAGMFPKFSRGTNKKKKYDLLKDAKKNKHEHGGMDAIGTGLAKNSAWGVSGGGTISDLWKAGSGAAKEGGKKAVVGTTKKAADTTKKGKEAVDTGKKVAEAAGKSAAKIGGDLLEYVGNPGKLVSAMLKKFGVDFGNVKGQIPKDMMWDPMWKGLKGGVKSLFDGWLTEADGAGDGGYIDLSHGINYGFGFPPGYPFNRPHNGLDIGYPYGSKLYSTLGGTATAKSGYNGGFGNSMWIKSGAMQAIYGHMSKLAFSGSKKVKPGSYLGLSGGDPSRQGRSAGDSTGPHLHYEMRKNGKPFDPTNWLKENNGSGGSKSASKWKSDIKKAAKSTGVSLSGGKLNDIVKLIATESNGNPKVMQGVRDVNSGSNAARGLLQYTPSTFKGYATKNGKNILNGMHQLKAFFNNSNWSRDLAAWKSRMARGSTGWGPTGGRRGYAKGTDSARSGLANVFEKGGEIMNLRGGEQIIPNDVSINALKSMMSSDLFSRTQSAVYAGISRYAEALEQKQEQKRIKELKAQQQANASSNEIAELKSMVADMVYLMQAQLSTQENIAGTNQQIANKDLTLDGKKISKNTSRQQGIDMKAAMYSMGGGLD